MKVIYSNKNSNLGGKVAGRGVGAYVLNVHYGPVSTHSGYFEVPEFSYLEG
jgi:hypothetical protein